MDQGNQLFTMALGLVPPWIVDEVRFTAEEKRLDLHVNFPKGRCFPCHVRGQDCLVYDTKRRSGANWISSSMRRISTPMSHGSRVQKHGVYLVPSLGRGNALDSRCSSRGSSDGHGTGDRPASLAGARSLRHQGS